MSVGDPADLPNASWLAFRPIVYSRLQDPRVKARLDAKIRVERWSDVPYICGAGINADRIFADLNFPITEAPVDGIPVDVTKYCWLHEIGEWCFIEFWGDLYDQAHKLITIAEYDAVVTDGLPPVAYFSMFQAFDRRDERENIQTVSRDLYLRPYIDSGDWLLLERMRRVMV